MEKKNGHAYSAGYDQQSKENDKSMPNGKTGKLNYAKLHIEDNANVDLANIVIENDPDDSNRYFKKTDMADWYRLIMKKKPPKDTEKLLDKTKGETELNHKQSEGRADDDRHKHRSHGKGTSGHRQHRSHTSDKRRRSSDRELSSTLPNTKDSKTTSKEKLSASLPMQSSSTKDHTVRTANPSPVKQPETPQPRVIMSKPLSASNLQSASLEHSNTGGPRDANSVAKDAPVSQPPVARARLIMSQPKQTSDMEAKDSKVPSQKRPENVPRLNLPK